MSKAPNHDRAQRLSRQTTLRQMQIQFSNTIVHQMERTQQIKVIERLVAMLHEASGLKQSKE